MIIPCMNSISACDGRGNVALVDAGSFLLGCPGAPGWTTTGVAAFAACARAEEDKKHEQILSATRNPESNGHPFPLRCLRLRQIPQDFHFAGYLNIFGWNFRLDLQEAVFIHPTLFRFKQIDNVATASTARTNWKRLSHACHQAQQPLCFVLNFGSS
jgi:hypothetical protein